MVECSYYTSTTNDCKMATKSYCCFHLVATVGAQPRSHSFNSITLCFLNRLCAFLYLLSFNANCSYFESLNCTTKKMRINAIGIFKGSCFISYAIAYLLYLFLQISFRMCLIVYLIICNLTSLMIYYQHFQKSLLLQSSWKQKYSQLLILREEKSKMDSLPSLSWTGWQKESLPFSVYRQNLAQPSLLQQRFLFPPFISMGFFSMATPSQ